MRTTANNMRRAARGFSMVEVMITFVVAGLLGTLGYVTYDNLNERAVTKRDAATLQSMMNEAVAHASLDRRDTFDIEDFVKTVESMADASAEGVFAQAPGDDPISDFSAYLRGESNSGTFAVYESTVDQPVPSLAYGDLSVAISETQDQAGVAMRTSNGNCAMALLGPGESTELWTIGDVGYNCNGLLAFGGPSATGDVTHIATPPGRPTFSAGGTCGFALPGSFAVTWTAHPTAPGSFIRVMRNGVAIHTESPAIDGTYIDNDIVPGVVYTYRVEAVDGVYIARSTLSCEYKPINAIPSPPTGLALTPGDAEVDVTWDALASTAATPVDGYRVYRSVSGDDNYVMAYQGTATSFTDTAVSNGITYDYTVAAFNPMGETAMSDLETATPITRPAAPANFTGLAGNTETDLSWDAVADTPSAPVTGYQLRRDGATVYDGTAITRNDTGLTNGVTYSYEVRAYGPAGESSWAGPVDLTPVAPPATPANLAASVANTQVNLIWDPVADSAAEPVTGYRLYRDGVMVYQGTATTYSNTGLVNGTEYDFTVTAYGIGGESAQSAQVPATPVQAPAIPTGLTATPGNTQMGLSWTPVTPTAAAPVSGYRVFQSGVQVWEGSATNTTITGLTNGTSYTFTVRAYNPPSESADSTSVSAIPVAPPATPTGLAGTVGTGSVALTWNTVATSAPAPVTGYRLFRDGVQIYQGATASYNDTGRTNGTDYTYTVAAYGSGGQSAVSAGLVRRPIAPPNNPTGVAATGGYSGYVPVSWTAQTSTNAQPLTGYRVYRSTNNSTWTLGATVAAPANSTNISGLSNGTTYYFQVEAYGTGGTSGRSSSVTATPVPPYAYPYPYPSPYGYPYPYPSPYGYPYPYPSPYGYPAPYNSCGWGYGLGCHAHPFAVEE